MLNVRLLKALFIWTDVAVDKKVLQGERNPKWALFVFLQEKRWSRKPGGLTRCW